MVPGDSIDHIKLMADYGCWPLWHVGEPGNLDPATLPLQPPTVERLLAWAAAFDASLDWANPPATTFGSATEERAFWAAFEVEGIALWHRLRAELGPAYTVVYHSGRLGRVVADPAELEQA
jgi:hypothetical protein